MTSESVQFEPVADNPLRVFRLHVNLLIYEQDTFRTIWFDFIFHKYQKEILLCVSSDQI